MARSASPATSLADIPARHRAQAALVADVADAVEALRVPSVPEPVRVRLIALIERADQVSSGVPVSVAASILRVSEPTVRSWIDRGALDLMPGVRPAAVTARSLGEAVAASSDIRTIGKDERLLRRVLDELADRRTRAELADRLDELGGRKIIDPDRAAEELFS
jgi:hypothetical protein